MPFQAAFEQAHASVGGTSGTPLIHKLVKTIEVIGSRTTDELRFNEPLIAKTEP